MRVCDAAIEVMVEHGESVLSWNDVQLLEAIARRAGLNLDGRPLRDRISATLTKAPGRLVRLKGENSNGRIRAFMLPERASPESRPCRWCDGPAFKAGRSGNWPLFCSCRCRSQHQTQYQREYKRRIEAGKPPKPCGRCGKPIIEIAVKYRRYKFCQEACFRIGMNERKRDATRKLAIERPDEWERRKRSNRQKRRDRIASEPGYRAKLNEVAKDWHHKRKNRKHEVGILRGMDELRAVEATP